jgi:hypothetical protein
MNCSIDEVRNLILWAILCLSIAIGLAYAWVAAFPLFAAAALVAAVSFYFIPKIKQALLNYAACRGPSDKCTISLGLNTLGQAAGILSIIAFLAAAALELTALAFISSWVLSWLGVSMQVAVAYLVNSGIGACAAVIAILLGVLADAYSYKNCMDQAGSGSVAI